MPVYIHHIHTGVPDTSYEQDFIRDLMKANVSSKRGIQSLIHRIYNQSGIAKRHSVIRDFNLNGMPAVFFDQNGNSLPPASTKARNETYTREAKKLFCQLAEATVESAAGIEKNDITHIITVSCTGFFAPGPDYYILRHLGLKESTQRFHLGFMGCYAAFPAMKMARAFCEADPSAVVLVVCLELCTLHLHLREELDDIISASVFGDGAASILISAREPDYGKPALKMLQLDSDLATGGEKDMAWTIGDQGFEMVLSTYVPDIIKTNIHSVLDRCLKNNGYSLKDIDKWAIHPGGRAILDKIQQSLELDSHQMASSRDVLKNFGNMSSATILFVLKDLMNAGAIEADGQSIMALAFGPGLTIETALFEKVLKPADELKAVEEFRPHRFD